MQTLSGCNYRSSYAYVSVYVFFYILSLSLSSKHYKPVFKRTNNKHPCVICSAIKPLLLPYKRTRGISSANRLIMNGFFCCRDVFVVFAYSRVYAECVGDGARREPLVRWIVCTMSCHHWCVCCSPANRLANGLIRGLIQKTLYNKHITIKRLRLSGEISTGWRLAAARWTH